MDADYGRNLDPDGAPDQGLRAEPLCLGDGDEPPDRRPRDRRRRPQGARLRLGPTLRLRRTRRRTSDEHGRLADSATTNRLALGDKIRPISGHSGIRGNRVEQLWPITTRGAVY
jgi:hypothetical protein